MTTLEAIDARLRAVEAKVDGVERALRTDLPPWPASPVSRPATGFRMSCPCGCGEELAVPVCASRSQQCKT